MYTTQSVSMAKCRVFFFRASTQDKAESLGILGWVKNEPDGTVKIEAEGPEQQMQEFIDWCKQGPTYAKVEKVDLKEDNPQGFVRFEIKQ
ncbi:acylphosphatase [Catalinimonas alkaloidigena]|uniref:acylphosphatase n=1 Tax=Catalinimonas alkaloidigena TaxID=1075417 RepID=UPI0030B88293|nr:acylphosphatase [Catalinimonas alkaloidigena]